MNAFKSCKECGDVLYGRSDKKYCSDQCRSTFNNRIYKESNNQIRKINSILRKNRHILSEFGQNETSRIRERKLNRSGFEFEYFTHIKLNSNGEQIRFCYDLGYKVYPEGLVELIYE